MSRRDAVSILILILAPVIFVVVLLIAFNLLWLLPVLLLVLIVAAGIANKKRPDFFAALRKKKKIKQEVVQKHSDEFKPSSSARRSFMMLVGISNGAREQVTVNSSPFVIGREAGSDYRISDNYVSKQHLVIEYNADDMLCYATDVSSNGSYLNSVRMQNNIRRPLHQGDTLQIAGHMFRVEYVHF